MRDAALQLRIRRAHPRSSGALARQGREDRPRHCRHADASAAICRLGATIHGAPGAPPPDAKMEELQMIAPMEYGDREAQPEATPGAKRERKG